MTTILAHSPLASLPSGPFSGLTESGLAEQTIDSLRLRFLERTAHRPTEEMYEALRSAALVLEHMADGTCPSNYFLSSLDPGVGKTSMVAQFSRNLLRSPKHKAVGMIICVARLSEIESLAAAMELDAQAYAAFTADERINKLGLGSARANDARILFTSQQMVDRRSEGRLFADISEFHYQGKPRSVRIWDEALLPGAPITIPRRAVLSLAARLLQTNYEELGAMVEDLAATVRDAASGSFARVPALDGSLGETDLQLVAESLSDYPEDQSTLRALYRLSGRCAVVRNDGGSNNTVLSYHESLPADFAPVLILDASGRVRKTYTLWEESPRDNLVVLPSATKTYSNLSCHVWNTSGAKSAFRDANKRKGLIDGVAELIATRPDEKWLVIHHKAEWDFDVEREISGLLSEHRRSDVAFVSWGMHKATNDYVSFPNIILAGTLFFPNSMYDALARLSAATPDGEPLAGDLFDDVILGEHMDQILQAACRGTVRQSQKGDCLPSNLYIIASAKSGIKRILQHVFPGSRLKPWEPSRRVLRGKVQEAVNFVREELGRDPQALVSFKCVQIAIGMNDRSNFRSHIRKNADFVRSLEQLGIVEVNGGRGKSGFMFGATMYGFDVEAA